MFEIISVGAVGTLVGAGISYVLLKRENSKQIDLFVLEGKAKANAIEFEAQKKLQDAQIKIKADELELERKFQDKINDLEKRSRVLEEMRQSVEGESQKIQGIKRRAIEKEESLERLIEQ
ncbi:MAG: ribonuclease Y, partial [Campylobacterales bacterium]|nr:ribonuclease Y [Campylobacterales bacterium]